MHLVEILNNESKDIGVFNDELNDYCFVILKNIEKICGNKKEKKKKLR